MHHRDRRSLRGNVDRNIKQRDLIEIQSVVPYVGTWIEIDAGSLLIVHGNRRSLRGNVDRNCDQIC